MPSPKGRVKCSQFLVTPESKRFAKRVFAAVMIIAAIAALTYAIPMILLVFAGVLLTVLLRAAGTWLSERSRLSTKWSQKTFEFFVPFVATFLRVRSTGSLPRRFHA